MSILSNYLPCAHEIFAHRGNVVFAGHGSAVDIVSISFVFNLQTNMASVPPQNVGVTGVYEAPNQAEAWWGLLKLSSWINPYVIIKSLCMADSEINFSHSCIPMRNLIKGSILSSEPLATIIISDFSACTILRWLLMN